VSHGARRGDEPHSLDRNSQEGRRRRRRLGQDRLAVGQRVALMMRARGGLDRGSEAHAENDRHDEQREETSSGATHRDHSLKHSSQESCRAFLGPHYTPA